MPDPKKVVEKILLAEVCNKVTFRCVTREKKNKTLEMARDWDSFTVRGLA